MGASLLAFIEVRSEDKDDEDKDGEDKDEGEDEGKEDKDEDNPLYNMDALCLKLMI